MAYSSDPSAVRGFIPPQNDEERRLMRRIEELCRLAESREIPRYTGFLSDREQDLAVAAMNRAGCGFGRFWGGWPGAERKVLCLEPPDTWREEPLGFLRIKAMSASDKMPSHRDYMGAILGLGLDRACLGDLRADAADDSLMYAVVLADKTEFIQNELTGVGRCPVQIEVCSELPLSVQQEPMRELQQATVPSLRADTVLAAMMHTSRTKAAELISGGRVEINHLPLHAAHEPVFTNDLFTVRGAGRYRLDSIGGKSRKDRLFITFFQY